MCKALEDFGKERAEKGADEALIKAVKNLMKNGEKSFNESCILLGINATDMARYRKMI